MGRIRLRTGRVARYAQTHRRARSGHREEGQWWLGDERRRAPCRELGLECSLRTTRLAHATVLSPRAPEGGGEACGEGRCQGSYSVSPPFGL